MILPRGITGFVEDGDDALPHVEFKRFKAACFEAARQIGAAVTVAASCEGEVTPNYHSVTVAARDRAVSILCNRHFPVIAFAKALAPGEVLIEFLDDPQLRETFLRDASFTVLAAEVLDSTIEDAMLVELGAAELEQMRYWRPRRVGDVVFNSCD